MTSNSQDWLIDDQLLIILISGVHILQIIRPEMNFSISRSGNGEVFCWMQRYCIHSTNMALIFRSALAAFRLTKQRLILLHTDRLAGQLARKKGKLTQTLAVLSSEAVMKKFFLSVVLMSWIASRCATNSVTSSPWQCVLRKPADTTELTGANFNLVRKVNFTHLSSWFHCMPFSASKNDFLILEFQDGTASLVEFRLELF